MKYIESRIELKEVKVDELKGISCDNCNCEIYPSETYYEVTIGHDKDDYSDHFYKSLELCSVDCLSKNMNDYYLNKGTGETSFYDIVERIYNTSSQNLDI